MREKSNFDGFSTNEEDNELELVKIAVGEKFPLFNDSFPKLRGTEGNLFEALDTGSGFLHAIYYPNITSDEVYAFTNLPVRVRIFESVEGYQLILFKYGKTQMILEIAFDPALYKDARSLQLAGENNLVNTYCIDSNTNIVKGIRSANLPLKFIQKCRESWSRAILTPEYSEGYAKWYLDLQLKYGIKELWNMGVDMGYLGDSYNLDEIYHSYKDE